MLFFPIARVSAGLQSWLRTSHPVLQIRVSMCVCTYVFTNIYKYVGTCMSVFTYVAICVCI
jgi:hypothetical protein